MSSEPTASNSNPSGTTPPRFSVEPYQPDGGVPPGGLVLLLTGAALTAVALGFALSFVGQWFYFPFIFPLVAGLALGGAVAGLVRAGKVRNAALVVTAAALSGVGMMLANHYFDYLSEYNNPAWQGDPPANVFEYIDAEAQTGVVIGDVGNGNNGMNLGYTGSYIYFVAEAFLAALCAFIVARNAALLPFCRNCAVWKPSRTLADLPHVPPKVAVEAVEAGALLDLVEIAAPPLSGCPLKLRAHVCPRCGDEGTLVAEVQLTTIDSRGRQYSKVLARSVYPAGVLALLNQHSTWRLAPAAPASNENGPIA
jgi:hypothetical protein